MKCFTLVFVCALSTGSSAIGRDRFQSTTPTQTSAASAVENTLKVSPDTTFFAKLTTPITISQAKNDDAVEAQTSQDIKQGHDVLLKKGSILLGHVRSVQAPTGDRPEYYVVIAFDGVKPKGGEEMSFSLIIQALAPESAMDSNREIADTTGTKLQGATRNAGVSGHAGSTQGTVIQLTGESKGVYGMQGLQLGDRLSDGKHYTVLASAQKDLQLKKGTQGLVMKVVSQ